jgi:hypothetical protein
MAIPLHAPHGTPKKVVTFFNGWYKSDVADHGRQLRNQLIDALGSEVALVLSHFDKDECASRLCDAVRTSLRASSGSSSVGCGDRHARCRRAL